MKNNLKSRHDATPTWSGFTHQGKVAILIILDLFLDNKFECYFESDKYEMELEWMEDISIKKESKYLSIHQVKAYQTGNISSYGDAIWMLLGKANLEKVPKTFLHTITDVKREVEKIKTHTLKETTEGYRTLVNDNECFDEVYANFNMYDYGNNIRFCRLGEIDNLIRDKISKVIEIENTVQKTENQINITYLHLLKIIHSNVTERHMEIQRSIFKQNDQSRTNIASISFSKIKETLMKDYEESSEEYYCLVLRMLFSSYTDEFITDAIEDGLYEEKVLDEFKGVVNRLSTLEDKEFQSFCKRISPHEKRSELTVSAFHGLLPKEGVLDSFFKIIVSLRQSSSYIDNGFQYEKDNKVYVPSIINVENDQARRIARGIIQNQNLLNELYLVDTIISRRMNIMSVGEASKKINEISSDEIKEENSQTEHRKITKIKSIRIIDLEKSIEELNT